MKRGEENLLEILFLYQKEQQREVYMVFQGNYTVLIVGKVIFYFITGEILYKRDGFNPTCRFLLEKCGIITLQFLNS